MLKCYMNCMFHEYEIVDDAGEFHMEKVKAKIPDSVREVALRLLDTCFDVHVDGETQCHRAFMLHSCWKKADPYVCLIQFRPFILIIIVCLCFWFKLQHYFLA